MNSYPQNVLRLNVLISGAKWALRETYTDSTNKGWLWQMHTLNDIANDSRRMLDQGKDGVKYFNEYLDEIHLTPSYIEELRA